MKITQTKIRAGVWKAVDDEGTFILRAIFLDSGRTVWQGNACESVDDCSDNNSCCIQFNTKRELVAWLGSF